MLNGDPVSKCLKQQVTMALLLLEVKYVALIFNAKDGTWLRLLLIKLGLLNNDGQFADIIVK